MKNEKLELENENEKQTIKYEKLMIKNKILQRYRMKKGN